MKRLNIVFIIALSLFVFAGSTNLSYAVVKKNPECYGSSKAVVVQLLGYEGVLANICPGSFFNSRKYNSYNSFCKNKGVLVHLNKNKDYYTNQLITLNRNECFVESGMYKYINDNNEVKTVRSFITGPRYLKY